MSTINCLSCGEPIEIDKALEGQIEARVLAAAHEKHKAELAQAKVTALTQAKMESDASLRLAKRQLAAESELAIKTAQAELEMEKRRIEAELTSANKKSSSEQALLIQALKEDAVHEKEASEKLREQLSELMKSFREEKQARINAQHEAEKKLAAGEDKIREEASKQASERYHLKEAEQAKKIADMQKALEDAQRKAAQGSQQNQGEVLEIDLENRLREEFPYDEIIEVKKGQRGADIKQVVKNMSGTNCGLLLWETKNGKWQPAWIAKFKADIREANASLGVIVSQETPPEIGDLKHIEGSVWVVTPRLATRLAAALRTTILQVDNANRMSAGKDAKMETLYQFLVGPEFKHRIEAIIESYSLLQDEMEKEKRAYALKWARQEKAIRSVVDNTIGMYGDLQGITNRALPSIRTLELDTGDEDEEKSQGSLL
jgi:hypothetical protein